MNSALKHRSVYLGLFCSQFFAIACNAFLDIQFGTFAYEMPFWGVIYGYSIFVAARQNGVANAYGESRKRRLLILSAILSAVIILPFWVFPRAVIYILVLLQASYNCITTTRRQLYMGILMSLVLVLFAASHYLANWTMIFYLVPYVISVVFTIVAEQINTQADEIRVRSLGMPVLKGQMLAIATATFSIFIISIFLYLITPQKILLNLHVNWSNPTANGPSNIKTDSRNNNASMASAGGDQGIFDSLFANWPSSADMRLKSHYEGMPKWQSSAIKTMADVSDQISKSFAPLKNKVINFLEQLKKQAQENYWEILKTIVLFCLIAIILALILLMRESKITTWIITRIDYLRLGIFRMYGNRGNEISKYYFAIERLFELKDLERSKYTNLKDYIEIVCKHKIENSSDFKELTRLFEDWRYGDKSINKIKLDRINALYKNIFSSLSK